MAGILPNSSLKRWFLPLSYVASIIPFAPVTVIVSALLIVCGSASAEFEPSQTLSVMVRESKVRTAPSHWSAAVADLKYGDTVTVISAGNPWVEVSVSSGAKGFVHASAVSVRRVILKADSGVQDSEVEPANVVLAGKGFNEDVEDLYRTETAEANFALLDSWEKQRVSGEELSEFVKSGGLKQ